MHFASAPFANTRTNTEHPGGKPFTRGMTQPLPTRSRHIEEESPRPTAVSVPSTPFSSLCTHLPKPFGSLFFANPDSCFPLRTHLPFEIRFVQFSFKSTAVAFADPKATGSRRAAKMSYKPGIASFHVGACRQGLSRPPFQSIHGCFSP